MPGTHLANGANAPVGANGTIKKPHPSPIALAHAVIRTTTENYHKMVQFYIRLLGAWPIHESDNLTFLRYDDEHHRIAIIQSPKNQPKPQNQVSAEVDHLAFTHATLTALAQTYRSLRFGPAPEYPIWSVNHGPTTSLYYRDPDGNKIELQVDNFDTSEEADAFMKSSLFAKNPIGTDFDPEEWSASILQHLGPNNEEGLSPEAVRKLKTRVEIGERHSTPPGLQE